MISSRVIDQEIEMASAIRRVREILEQWSEDIASTTEQDYYNKILKALNGETNEA